MLRTSLTALTISVAALGAISLGVNAQGADEIAASVETQDAVAASTFSGLSDHVTTGAVSITGTEGNYTLVFADDFSLDGAPDPVVGFGNDGAYDTGSQLGALAQLTGSQSYALPADFSVADYNEVYVWCEQFSVPLGVASFTVNNTPRNAHGS
ncbi:MAG: DM13 domain-containing protein [Pseudomonadota bacterium]